MSANLPPLAIAIRRARGKAELTQDELASKSGVARPTIANIERGVHKSVRMGTLQRLAKALGASTAELLGEAEEPLSQRGGGTSGLSAKMVKEYRLTKDEVVWLEQQGQGNWMGREPTLGSLLHLLSAFRLAKK